MLSASWYDHDRFGEEIASQPREALWNANAHLAKSSREPGQSREPDTPHKMAGKPIRLRWGRSRSVALEM
jgi:hypothetical protein